METTSLIKRRSLLLRSLRHIVDASYYDFDYVASTYLLTEERYFHINECWKDEIANCESPSTFGNEPTYSVYLLWFMLYEVEYGEYTKTKEEEREEYECTRYLL